jgi:hypothetical protein
MDCCPQGTVSGAVCPSTISLCYTRCVFADDAATQGIRSEFSCSGGVWTAGHGVFPCSRA